MSLDPSLTTNSNTNIIQIALHPLYLHEDNRQHVSKEVKMSPPFFFSSNTK